jgi:tetratricopeptide (TPR) repeat protein
MLALLADFAWRTLLLIWLGAAPYVAPVAPAPPSAVSTLVLLLCLAVAISYGLRRLGSGRRIAATLTLVTVAVAAGAVLYFQGPRGPAARGVWLVAPCLWAAIVASVFAALAAQRNVVRWGVASACAAAAIASAVLGYRRIGTYDRMLAAALAEDPAAETMVAALAPKVTVAERRDLCRTCASSGPSSCACALGATELALDHHEYAAAWASISERASGCPRSGRLLGLRAEAQIGVGNPEQANGDADLALAAQPDEPHALVAKCIVGLRAGDAAGAKRFAERAVAAGRGVVGETMLGVSLVAGHELDLGRAKLERVLAARPDDVVATYYLALVAQEQDRYRDAREGFLRVLTLDPTYLDARFNLAVMTHRAGADLEAHHHLDELQRREPDGYRSRQAQAIVDGKRP